MKITNLFSFRFKYRVLLFLQQYKELNYFINTIISKDKKYAYLFLAADYGNLGDVAITYAQTKFIKEKSDFEVVKIPISKSLEGLWFVKNNIKKGDIVTTVGGGNLGDMYNQIEYIRQLVVSFFPNNKIVSFPQTFDFSSSLKGRRALNTAKNIYNSHLNIHFFAREETSFNFMKTHFKKAKVYLIPDIVLSLNKQNPIQKRKGVVICMRQDNEKKLTNGQSLFLKRAIEKRFKNISYYDTHINKNELSLKEGDFELNKIWNAFRSAELVITDRLHGMIFCYITNTPCLVFQNNNHKVRETYDWIKGNLNINLIVEYSEDRVISFFKQEYFNLGQLDNLKEKYQPLKNLLN